MAVVSLKGKIMFISSTEKSLINARIQALEEKVQSLTAMIALASTKSPEVAKPKARKWSDESRASQSVSMKKYWAEKKAKAAA